MKREASSNDSSEESVKTLHYDSPDDDQSHRAQSKAEQSMEEHDSSDDSYEKLNTCLECNKVMKPGQPCYKNEKKVHKECGQLRRSCQYDLKKHDPTLLKTLNEVRKNDKKGYRNIIKKTGLKKGSRGKLSAKQKSVLRDSVREVNRLRQLVSKEGMLMLDDEEYVQYMKLRKGWKRKRSRKHWKAAKRDKDSLFRTLNGVEKLAVEKPQEFDFQDIVQMAQKARGKKGLVPSIGKGWGSGELGAARALLSKGDASGFFDALKTVNSDDDADEDEEATKDSASSSSTDDEDDESGDSSTANMDDSDDESSKRPAPKKSKRSESCRRPKREKEVVTPRSDRGLGQ